MGEAVSAALAARAPIAAASASAPAARATRRRVVPIIAPPFARLHARCCDGGIREGLRQPSCSEAARSEPHGSVLLPSFVQPSYTRPAVAGAPPTRQTGVAGPALRLVSRRPGRTVLTTEGESR